MFLQSIGKVFRLSKLSTCKFATYRQEDISPKEYKPDTVCEERYSEQVFQNFEQYAAKKRIQGPDGQAYQPTIKLTRNPAFIHCCIPGYSSQYRWPYCKCQNNPKICFPCTPTYPCHWYPDHCYPPGKPPCTPPMKPVEPNLVRGRRRIYPPPICDGGPIQANPCCPVDRKPRSTLYKMLALPLLLAVILLSVYTETTVCDKASCRDFEYMRRRTKRFPWGDGTKSLFHNDHVNHLPGECEPPPYICHPCHTSACD